jgi:predicted DCC family thiol-disulfide oxidoreductase YuxK
MKYFFDLIKKLYNKKIDASGLAVFRVFYGLVLLCEVIQLYYFRHLIFDKIPFLIPAEINFGIPLLAWMVAIIFIIFGLFTKLATIINYLFSLVFIATISTYEYHMFYVYMGVNFLLIFINISKTGSLDSLWLKLQYSNTRVNYNPIAKTSVLNYYALILIGIAFVYFDSVFYKFASQLWLDGLGVWLPASLLQITYIDSSFFLNQKWLVLGLGYLTLVFELIFIFVFFRKNWRVLLFIIGVLFHVGIILQFPIPWFGLGVIALYTLMVPVSWWGNIKHRLKFKTPRLTFFYDEECPLCNRTRIILSHLDFFEAIEFKGVQTFGFADNRLKHYSKDELLDNIYSITKKNRVLSGVDTYKKSFKYIPLLFPLGILINLPGIYHLTKATYKLIAENRVVDRCTEENCGFTPPSFPKNSDEIKIFKTLQLIDLKVYGIGVGVLFLIFLQLSVTYNASLVTYVKNYTGLNNTEIGKSFNSFSENIKSFSEPFLGITGHTVFLNRHFDNYNHTIGVVYLNDNKRIWLPMTNSDGTLGLWQSGPIWAKWGFRTNSATINYKKLNIGLRDFTAFWAVKNGISLEDATFQIMIKINDSPLKWEHNFLKKQLLKPWISGGYVEWKNENFYSYIKDIESL